MWIQPLDATAKLMERAREAFESHGRQARFGLRTHLVVRDTEEEAWDAAEELLSQAEAAVEDQRSSQVRGTPMAGAAIQARKYEQHRVGERLWNGISTVRVNWRHRHRGHAATGIGRNWRATGISASTNSSCPVTRTWRSRGRVARKVIPRVRELVAARAVV